MLRHSKKNIITGAGQKCIFGKKLSNYQMDKDIKRSFHRVKSRVTHVKCVKCIKYSLSCSSHKLIS